MKIMGDNVVIYDMQCDFQASSTTYASFDRPAHIHYEIVDTDS